MSFSPEKALELLQTSQQNGRLAHAYLVTGAHGSGKERLAMQLIEMVNGNVGAQSLGELESSVVTIVSPESKSRRISVETIRKAEHVLKMAAPEGVTKFAVIVDADRMNDASANAFLKTLEEPPASSRLILLTSAPEQLLDTILSRCIKISLAGKSGPVEIEEGARGLLDILRDHALSGNRNISGALGVMAKFSAILKQEKASIAERNKAAEKQEVEKYAKRTEGDYLKQRENYYKALTEAEYIEQRNRLTEYLVMWFGDALRQQNGSQHLDLPDYAEATGKLAQDFQATELTRKVDAVQELRSNLNTNAFEPLVLEAGFIRAFG